jgi:hypothetical protein
MQQSPPWEANSSSVSHKTPSILWSCYGSLPLLQELTILPYPIYAPPINFLMINFNIIYNIIHSFQYSYV